MATSSSPAVSEPFPIFKLAHKHLLYDADTVAHVRREHNICGVFIGGLPQAPQQNVFLGLPLELMPEEAKLLVEKGVAYVVDDVKAHKTGFMGNGLGEEERRAYQNALSRRGMAAAKEREKQSDDRKKTALNQKFGNSDWNDIPEDMFKPSTERSRKKKARGRRDESGAQTPALTPARTPAQTPPPPDQEETLFSAPPVPSSPRPQPQPQLNNDGQDPEPAFITPTTSYPPLAPPNPSNPFQAPSGSSHDIETPTSYPLFAHMHARGYFMAPGLRFGCQYMAYPGDPLRFHSHFLCSGMEWDQEFDLLDLVGGGRLGTGVKKGFCIGGREAEEDGRGEGDVRAFCVEWGGM